ncbi:MAG: hypothetical protein OQK12_09470 [Motiliproteus sp.]|nr:hypothetical protein [Motiliproteus sp.]MCW9052367.1 hypothetical protein [Motiliproteus sp.]
MISGISGASAMAAMPPPQQSNSTQALSDDQLQLIEETLAQYDSESLSESDAAAIVEVFSEAGIEPGKELASAMGEFGFDAKTVGDLAGVEGPGQGGPSGAGGNPPPPPELSSLGEEGLQTLNELLNEYYSGELTDEEQGTTLSSIQELLSGAGASINLVDVTA